MYVHIPDTITITIQNRVNLSASSYTHQTLATAVAQ